ncbi:MAG: molecular chaperone GrpE [Acidobacteriota bacterium]|nr:molecular chaperone GrpE [Acidobacteriota bacterium]
MIEKNPTTSSRIPVRFMDDDEGVDAQRGETAPEELGRASAYEGETEMRQRIDRDEESDAAGGRGRADEADTAGAPRESELPENREEQDTQLRRAQGPSDDQDARMSSSPRAMHSGVSVEAELLAAQAEAQVLEDEVKKLKLERQELIELMARRQADFDNLRKRNERERAETYTRVAGEVASRILPVLDNMRRAVAAETSVEATESKEFREFLHGVELISRQLNGVLEDLGVVPVPTVGHRFDPHVHEAVAMERTDAHEPDTITQEMQRGYRIGEKLLRPAMVKVSTR